MSRGYNRCHQSVSEACTALKPHGFRRKSPHLYRGPTCLSLHHFSASRAGNRRFTVNLAVTSPAIYRRWTGQPFPQLATRLADPGAGGAACEVRDGGGTFRQIRMFQRSQQTFASDLSYALPFFTRHPSTAAMLAEVQCGVAPSVRRHLPCPRDLLTEAVTAPASECTPHSQQKALHSARLLWIAGGLTSWLSRHRLTNGQTDQGRHPGFARHEGLAGGPTAILSASRCLRSRPVHSSRDLILVAVGGVVLAADGSLIINRRRGLGLCLGRFPAFDARPALAYWLRTPRRRITDTTLDRGHGGRLRAAGRRPRQ